MSKTDKKAPKDDASYAKSVALLVTAKAIIILVALAIILFFKAIF